MLHKSTAIIGHRTFFLIVMRTSHLCKSETPGRYFSNSSSSIYLLHNFEVMARKSPSIQAITAHNLYCPFERNFRNLSLRVIIIRPISNFYLSTDRVSVPSLCFTSVTEILSLVVCDNLRPFVVNKDVQNKI